MADELKSAAIRVANGILSNRQDAYQEAFADGWDMALQQVYRLLCLRCWNAGPPEYSEKFEAWLHGPTPDYLCRADYPRDQLTLPAARGDE